MEEASVKCIFLSYSSMSKTYKLYNLKNKKVFINRDVLFDEKAKWIWEKKKLKVIVIQLVIWSKKSVRKEKEKYPDPRTSVLSSSSSISKKMKSLHEGYTKYNFCVVELKNFEEASKEKEIEMIENNVTKHLYIGW